MKKQIKKLSLNKRTISNLGTPEMTKIVGGNPTNGNNCTQNGGATNGQQCTNWCDTLRLCTRQCHSLYC